LAAIAEAMAFQGARVVISSRNQDKCDEVAAAICARQGAGSATAIAASISSKNALHDLVDRTQAEVAPTISSSAMPLPIRIMDR